MTHDPDTLVQRALEAGIGAGERVAVDTPACMPLEPLRDDAERHLMRRLHRAIYGAPTLREALQRRP